MKQNKRTIGMLGLLAILLVQLLAGQISAQSTEVSQAQSEAASRLTNETIDAELPVAQPGQATEALSQYTDDKGDRAYIPEGFTVSDRDGEQTIQTGLVVIGPDGSEYVWVPTKTTALAVRDLGNFFYGTSLDNYYDESDLAIYQEMVASVAKYEGFYIGRFEASKGDDGLPVSKRITDTEPGRIMVQYSPQDATLACQQLYASNETVQGFFPWGITWDTTAQWLVDSGNKTMEEIREDSTSWGNYSNDSFSPGANGRYTGKWEEAKANNIYDLAGNNWEWTQERNGTNYVMRGGGYNRMGGESPGNLYPMTLRNALPGNNHHPNVAFRTALYLK